jgi:hypothetical protein
MAESDSHGRGWQGQFSHIHDRVPHLRVLAAVVAGEEQAVHGLLRAGQGSQVPVGGNPHGLTGVAGIVCKIDGLCHDGSKGNHYVH